MSNPDVSAPYSVIFGCAGTSLSDEERRFFAETPPLGFILFANNVESPDQLCALTTALRAAVGRADAPILIDQEGGRVARLRPPHWDVRPPAGTFADLARHDPEAGREAARLNSRLIADDLHRLGINVDCAPVVDVPAPDGHDIIGDRAYGETPDQVSVMGREVCAGLMAGGVMPVIKHMPGHGRARADSHVELPVVDASAAELRKTDFRPFAELADMPCAMTAHVLYTAFDAERCATVSPTLIADVIRGEIGFKGLIYSDDLSMEALAGSLAERAAAVIGAGCDIALYCGGVLDEMREVAEAAGRISDATAARIARANDMIAAPQTIDRPAVEDRLAALLGRMSGGAE